MKNKSGSKKERRKTITKVIVADKCGALMCEDTQFKQTISERK